MAGTLVPLALAAVSAIGPQIPGVVAAIESLFGHSSVTGKQTGPQKMDTVVTVLETILQGLANSGLLPSASVVDPALRATLAGAAQNVVDGMKSLDAAGPLAAIPPSTITVYPGLGGPWTLTGTICASSGVSK